jgi:hypothetical protein
MTSMQAVTVFDSAMAGSVAAAHHSLAPAARLARAVESGARKSYLGGMLFPGSGK